MAAILEKPAFRWVRSMAAAIVLAGSLSAGAATAREADVVVEMTGELTFAPRRVTISTGDTVEWRNVSGVVHTVTADPQLASNPENVVLPKGAETFDSGTILPKGSFKYTFSVPGRYRYVCLPHEAAGMIGEVIVE